MTDSTSKRGQPSKNWRSLLFKLGTGALTGFLASFGIISLLDSGVLGEIGESREIATLVATIYFLCGAIVAFGLVSPRWGARLLNVEDAEEIEEMRPMLAWSCVGTFALALALAVAALAAPVGPIAQIPALALIIALFAAAWYAGSRQRAHTDELMRAVSSQATSVAFYLSVVIGGGWSLLAHLDIVAVPLSPLDWLSLFAGLLLVAAFYATIHRGMIRDF